MQIREENIHIVEALDTFIQRRHDCRRVFRELQTRRLFLLRFCIAESREHIYELGILLEQSANSSKGLSIVTHE